MDPLNSFFARVGLSGAGAWLMNRFFGLNAYELLGSYIVCGLLDIVTGLGAAIQTGTPITAKKMFPGLAKKVCCVAAISLGHQVDVALGTGDWARNWLGLLVIFYEVTSNTENLAVMGIIVPESIGGLFARVLESKEKATPTASREEVKP